MNALYVGRLEFEQMFFAIEDRFAYDLSIAIKS